MSNQQNALSDDQKVMQTLIEMFRDRGYTFPDRYAAGDLLLARPDQWEKLPFFGNRVTNLNDLIKDNDGHPVYVHIMKDEEPFSGSKHKESVSKEISRNLNPVFPDLKVSNKDLEEVYNRVHLFIIFRANRNPNKRYEMTKFETESFPISSYEVWPKHRLRFNVTKHSRVSKHTKLTPEQLEEYKTRFNLNNSNIQKMCWDDPVSRYYDGKPEEVFRIDRIGQGINYRIVSKKMLSSLKTK